jgi:hypothetical protein
VANRRFLKVLKAQGWCCEYAFMALNQHPDNRGLTNRKGGATYWSLRLEVCERTIYHARARFDRGEMKCEGCGGCLKLNIKNSGRRPQQLKLEV